MGPAGSPIAGGTDAPAVGRRRRASWPAICALGAGLILLYFLLPGDGAKDAAYLAIGAAATAAMALWALDQPTHRRVAWYLIAVANGCFVLGDGLGSVVELVTGEAVNPPSAADALYLAGYPFLLAGVSRLSNLRNVLAARETRADAALVSLGALCLSWHFLLDAYATDDALSLAGKIVTLAYPILDIGVLYLIVYGIFSGAVRETSGALIGLAMTALVVCDFAYSELALAAGYTADSIANAGFLAAYVLFAAAAATRSTLPPDPPAPPAEARHWLPLIGAALFVPPGILLLAALSDSRANVTVIAALSVVLTAVAVLRASWIVQRMRAQADLLARRGESLRVAASTQHELQRDLEFQASHDGLTGLANRGLLNARLGAVLRADAGAAVLFCDLDGFKEVNDSLGHGVGDQLLVVVGKRLSAAVRSGDLVSRLGGDEFAILLDGAGPDTAVAMADRVVAVLQQPIVIGELRLRLTVSVGVAVARAGSTPETLLSEADAAMYEAKGAGKNRLAVFEARMRERLVHRRAVVTNFEGSLDEGQWLLEYQPVVQLRDGQLLGFEALTRWQHPTLGLLMPDTFIAVAEETGFISQLGRWIVDTATAEAARWPAGAAPLSVSVNVSGRQLHEGALVGFVQAALARSGLPPRNLIIEIAETTLVHEPLAIANLRTVRGLGVRVAIDDFGTGYSSLSHLRGLPVDILKLDRSFIAPLVDADGDGAAFVEIILRLARHLDLRTTAEGVEVLEQYETLRTLGCDTGQGYLLAPPLRADEVPAYIANFQPIPVSTAR